MFSLRTPIDLTISPTADVYEVGQRIPGASDRCRPTQHEDLLGRCLPGQKGLVRAEAASLRRRDVKFPPPGQTRNRTLYTESPGAIWTYRGLLGPAQGSNARLSSRPRGTSRTSPRAGMSTDGSDARSRTRGSVSKGSSARPFCRRRGTSLRAGMPMDDGSNTGCAPSSCSVTAGGCAPRRR
jgi:hypothetical protein